MNLTTERKVMNNELKHGVIAATAAAVLVAASPAVANPELGGRLHLDYAFYDEDATPLNDAIRVRRARLGASGSLDDNWSYKSEVDLAENSVDWKDMYLRHNNLGSGRLTIGQIKVPFGMDEMTSSNNIPFMERASPMAFALAHRIGLHYATSGDNYTFTAMGFGQAVGGGDGGDEGLGFGARATFTPMRTDNGLFHIGAAIQSYKPSNDTVTTMRFRQRPESRPDGSRLIDTGNITNADSTMAYGLEAAFQHGPFVVQGEYMASEVDRTGANPDAMFDGYYVQAGYFLTGERRSYSNSSGVFGGPRLGDSGAWEIVGRFSSLDLNDSGPAIFGGEMQNFTLGVNWYPRRNVRFMFNYVNVSSTVAGIDNDPSILQVRAQVSF
jgi:phosphate-selective porin OprO and OprP